MSGKDYIQACNAKYSDDGKLSISAEVLLPSKDYQVVPWYEENPNEGEIKCFFELRKPIRSGKENQEYTALPMEKYDVEQELKNLLPGEYRRLSFYVEGVYYKTSTLEQPLKVA